MARSPIAGCVLFLRWVPFVFIMGLISFVCVVLLDLHARYSMIKRHEYLYGAFNVLVVVLLAGVTSWSFLVAVFKSPGYPRGVVKDSRWDQRGSQTESRWERRERLREENIGLLPEGEEIDDEDVIDSQEQGEEEDSDAFFGNKQDTTLITSPNVSHSESSREHFTEAFAGGSRILPGQPKVPSRTGRTQLNDIVSIVEQGKRERPDGKVFLGGLQVKNSGGRRWCNKCACEKPDRAHHCSTCGVCVLRMDHHCPWLASRCIGLRNHKAFFLFLMYTSLFCAFAVQDSGRELIRFVDQEPKGYETSPITWAIVFFSGFIFGMALIPFTAYHAYLILQNRTTLESMEGGGRVRISVSRPSSLPPRESVSDRLRRLAGNSAAAAPSTSLDGQWRRDEELSRDERKALAKANKINIYYIGMRENWKFVMGRNALLWWVPIGDPESDGYSYEVNVERLRILKETTDSIRDFRRPNHSNAPPISSVRGQSRTPTTKFRPKKGHKKQLHNAHGIAEWGDSPRKDFVLYEPDDDEFESNNSTGVLGGDLQDSREQMDANIWS